MWDLLSLVICPSILVIKITTWFANVARTAASTSKFFASNLLQTASNLISLIILVTLRLYTRIDFTSSGNSYKKYFLILKKVKTSLMLNFSLQNCLESFESSFYYGAKFFRSMQIWLNGWVFVYELSGFGFESRCCYFLNVFALDVLNDFGLDVLNVFGLFAVSRNLASEFFNYCRLKKVEVTATGLEPGTT